VVRTTSGEWKNFLVNSSTAIAQIVIDDFNQKWIQAPRGTGIVVYNHGVDILDASDDEERLLTIGAGNGNLSTNVVYCLLKDLDGEIWVGTSEGISIFYNPGEIFSGTTSGDASQPLVNLGGYNEYLLSKEVVTCMAVDGANRKWVGTNSGVFLISEDGTEQLLFFNEENSPLLSNTILSITIDGETGEVFFGTSKGIVSFRYTATDGAAEHTAVKVFPNPVRENYNGLIAISGLVQNAQVKITDDAGRLMYETTALGGQAVWDGKGYNGQRAQTGVYLVYSSNDDGTETFVTKFLILN
jgi:ligand-binding sensor domain-containing protein